MRLSLFAAAALCVSSLAAHADLMGDTVHVTYNYDSQDSVYEDDGIIVVPGATQSLGQFTIALTGTRISITDTDSSGFTGASFNGFVFTDESRNPMISSVVEDSASTLKGGIASFTADQVAINFQGLPAGVGEVAIFDLGFASDMPVPPSSVTPEPSSFALLGTGLLGAAGVLRKRFAETRSRV